MGKRELIAFLNLSSWCLVMVERLFLAVPRGCLQFVIVVFPDHTHLLFFIQNNSCFWPGFKVVISVFWDLIWVRCVFEQGGGGEVGHIIRIRMCYPFP